MATIKYRDRIRPVLTYETLAYIETDGQRDMAIFTHISIHYGVCHALFKCVTNFMIFYPLQEYENLSQI